MINPRYLTKAQMARKLEVSKPRITQMVHEKKLKTVMVYGVEMIDNFKIEKR